MNKEKSLKVVNKNKDLKKWMVIVKVKNVIKNEVIFYY